MNNRKIKLALTIGLMNSEKGINPIGFIRELMLGFKEVGKYIGMKMVKNAKLNTNNFLQTYAFQFENCTLSVDLVSNPKAKFQHVQSFNIR